MRCLAYIAFTGVLAVAVVFAGASGSTAKDHFLTIGGGYGPTGNQLSIESNVKFVQDFLDSRQPEKPPHDVFFADGEAEERDVQYTDANFKERCTPARRMMA